MSQKVLHVAKMRGCLLSTMYACAKLFVWVEDQIQLKMCCNRNNIRNVYVVGLKICQVLWCAIWFKMKLY